MLRQTEKDKIIAFVRKVVTAVKQRQRMVTRRETTAERAKAAYERDLRGLRDMLR